MYESLGRHTTSGRPAAVSWALSPIRVSQTVIALGLTSLFTDISSEMVNAALPLYLVLHLGFSPIGFGLFEGLYQGATVLVRIAGGTVADRHSRHKQVAGAGYALSTVCKLGLWGAGPAWLPTVGLLLLDRVGKGVRTAPRDALIALSSPSAKLGEAFAVHRALDALGALLGPIVAFALLDLVPGGYDVVFASSFCAGAIGLAILVTFVPRHAPAGEQHRVLPSLRDVGQLIRDRGVRGVMIAAGLLSIVTVSDSFVYLTLQRTTAMPVPYVPLLFVGTALVYLLLAVPAGRLADHVGRRGLFLAGHLGLGALYAWLMLRSAPGPVDVVLCLVLLGTYYAATDGVVMAIGSSRLPPGLMTTGLAVLATMIALGKLLASTLYGAIWTWGGVRYALGVFALGILAATAAAAIALRPHVEKAAT